LDDTNWRHQQESIQWKHADLQIVAHDILSIIPHCVGVEASYSLWRDVIGKRQSNTTGKTHCKNLIGRQHARATNEISAPDHTVLDTMSTENYSELKREVEERNLH
jgi:hypothetical protein